MSATKVLSKLLHSFARDETGKSEIKIIEKRRTSIRFIVKCQGGPSILSAFLTSIVQDLLARFANKVDSQSESS